MLAILYSNLLYFWKKNFFLTIFMILLFWFSVLYFLSLLTLVDGREVLINWSFMLLDILVFLILFIFWVKFFDKNDKTWVSTFLWSKKLKIWYIYNWNLLWLFIIILLTNIIFFLFLIFFKFVLSIPISFAILSTTVLIWLIKYTLILSVFAFFSTFISNFLVIFLMICFYFIGHSLDFLYRYINTQTTTNLLVENIISFVYYVFPSFDAVSVDNIISNWYNYNVLYWIIILLIYTIFMSIFWNIIYSKTRKYWLVK